MPCACTLCIPCNYVYYRYIWEAETAAAKLEWFDAVQAAIRAVHETGGINSRGSLSRLGPLAAVRWKPQAERLDVLTVGTTLTLYGDAGRPAESCWVRLSQDQLRLCWGDGVSRATRKELRLRDARSLSHGADAAAFRRAARATGGSFSPSHKAGGQRRGRSPSPPWLCFSVVFKSRTLCFAADTPGMLFDWYLTLAALLPASSPPPLTEASLRARIDSLLVVSLEHTGRSKGKSALGPLERITEGRSFARNVSRLVNSRGRAGYAPGGGGSCTEECTGELSAVPEMVPEADSTIPEEESVRELPPKTAGRGGRREVRLCVHRTANGFGLGLTDDNIITQVDANARSAGLRVLDRVLSVDICGTRVPLRGRPIASFLAEHEAQQVHVFGVVHGRARRGPMRSRVRALLVLRPAVKASGSSPRRPQALHGAAQPRKRAVTLGCAPREVEAASPKHGRHRNTRSLSQSSGAPPSTGHGITIGHHAKLHDDL